MIAAAPVWSPFPVLVFQDRAMPRAWFPLCFLAVRVAHLQERLTGHAAMEEVQLTLPLKREFAMQVLDKSKIWEARKFNAAKDSKRKLGCLKVGDFIAFHWYATDRVRAKIAEVRQFTSIEQMLHELGTEALLPSLKSAPKEEAVDSWI